MTDLVRLNLGELAGPLVTVPSSPVRLFLSRFTNRNSRRGMEGSLRAVLQVSGVPRADAPETILNFPWHTAIDFETATRVRTALDAKYRPHSVARHLSAVVGVLTVAMKLGLYSRETLHGLRERGGPLRAPNTADEPPAGRMLSPLEVVNAIDAAERAPRKNAPHRSSRRDIAILALAAFTGLRRFEIAGLNLADVDLISQKVTVQGKGARVRIVTLPEGARKPIEEYLIDRSDVPGPLFWRGVRGGGRLIPGHGISPTAVYNVIIHACTQLDTRATPHDFRRTYASTLIDQNMDLVTVRDLMGHRSVDTTTRYDRRGDERMRRAGNVLDAVFKREP
jgi:integrase/recombinase XerD